MTVSVSHDLVWTMRKDGIVRKVCLSDYIDTLNDEQEKINNAFKITNTPFNQSTFSPEIGRKYVKIWATDSHDRKYVSHFIEIKTGNIHSAISDRQAGSQHDNICSLLVFNKIKEYKAGKV